MPFSDSRKLNLFLSYASEDQSIADAVANTLRAAFHDAIELTMMSEFQVGLNWNDIIDDSIAKTDILIAIATGQLKPGHSFTGYEIGSFNMSARTQPTMTLLPKQRRRLIPFAILHHIPGTMTQFQGVNIDPKILHSVSFDPSDLAGEMQKLSKDASDEATQDVFKFLADIDDVISKADQDSSEQGGRTIEKRGRIAFLSEIAFNLCNNIFSIMSNREKGSPIIPKSKVIIRLPPRDDQLGNDLSEVSLKIEGSCSEVFGLGPADKLLDWKSFTAKTGADIAYGWKDTFTRLLVDSDGGRFIDNNVILSFDRRKMFRLFVSKITTFYSGFREYHIYVIELLMPKYYGDPDTTTLLRALQASLAYRFMFLENTSEFSPTMFTATPLDQLRIKAGRMLNSLNLLLQFSNESHLEDPEVILSILGMQAVKSLEKLYETWDREKNGIYQMAQQILVEPVDRDLKNRFIERLTSFCDHTREMNQNYTTKVMQELSSRIGSDRKPGRLRKPKDSTAGSRQIGKPRAGRGRARTSSKTESRRISS